MRSQSLRTWLGYGSFVLFFAACSSSNDNGGDAVGGNSEASGGLGQSSAGSTAGSAQAGTKANAGSGTIGKAGAAGAETAAAGDGNTPAGQVVGKSGGMVEQDGVTLVVPPNAVSQATPITVTTISAPAGFTLASDAFQFGPDGTQFAQPVAVTIPLSAAQPNAHLFWSNANGGFDDIGGTVTAGSITGSVTHFSIGFAAKPVDASGDGGAGGAPAAAGADGSGTAGAPETGGSGGTGGSSDIGGTGGTGGNSDTGGTGGTGGTADGGGSSGASSGASGSGGAGGSGGASGSGGAGGSGGGSALCTVTPLNLPFIMVTNTAGLPPDSSTYAGGTLVSGSFYEMTVSHYGNGQYSGPGQALYKIDTTAMTIQIGERLNNVAYNVGMTYTQTDAHTLHATVVCDTSGSYPLTFDYDFAFVNQVLVMTIRGSADVMKL
ncbi:MAG TPA: hypothetical protein VNG33_04720 [Polyangiaceae bacterium]|nr:hypothetical protein [Polyangiaceae bacterium]